MLALKILGAGRHVGKSASLVQIENSTVLFDCGIQVTNNGAAKFPCLRSLYKRIPPDVLPVEALNSPDSSYSLNANFSNQAPWRERPYEQDFQPKPSSYRDHIGPAMFSTNVNFCKKSRNHLMSSYQCIVDVVLITHFHLDHIGALPFLTEVLGYEGLIFMTEATFSQAKLQLEDCWLNQTNYLNNTLKHMETCETLLCDATPENDQGFSASFNYEDGEIYGYSPVDKTLKNDHEFPSYWETPIDYSMIQSCLSKVKLLSFSDSTVVKTLKITLMAAGHVPGACMFLVEGLSSGHSVLYTGDYTTNGEQIIPVAQVPKLHPTLLLSEGTYASQVRESKRAVERELCSVVENAVRRQGNVLIPMSALGKAQELALMLASHWKACGVKVPIVLASGMMEKAFTALKESSSYLVSNQKDIFDLISFMDVKRVLQCAQETPLVYLCSPRSLHGGSSLQMLRAWGTNPLNLILLVGFSLPGTIAHEIIKGSKCLDLPGPNDETCYENIDVEKNLTCFKDSRIHQNKEVRGNQEWPIHNLTPQNEKFMMSAKMRYFSLGSHADSLAIQTFVQYTSPLMTVLVHGEGSGLDTLARQLNQAFHRPALAPSNDDTIVVCWGRIPSPVSFIPLRHQILTWIQKIDLSSLPISPFLACNPCNLDLRKGMDYQFIFMRKWLSSQWSRSHLKFLRHRINTEPRKTYNYESLLTKWCPSLISRLSSSVPFFIPLDLLHQQFTQALQNVCDSPLPHSVKQINDTPLCTSATSFSIISPASLPETFKVTDTDTEEGEIK